MVVGSLLAQPFFFGGGSIFHAMVAETEENMDVNMHAQQNPMYGNLGMQSGMQGGLMGALGMINNALLMQQGQQASLFPTGGSAQPSGVVPQGQQAPFLQVPVHDGLDACTRIKDYKEGGSFVKFEVFHGHSDRSKVLMFIQQFDTTFMGGIFYESSRIRKAATFLKGNAL